MAEEIIIQNKPQLDKELTDFLTILINREERGKTKREWLSLLKGYYGFKSDAPAISRIEIMVFHKYLLPTLDGYKINPKLVDRIMEDNKKAWCDRCTEWHDLNHGCFSGK